MFLRVMSAVAAVVVVAVFLLPSTLAIYGVVNGTAWDLQDVNSFVPPIPAVGISALAVLLSPVRLAMAPQDDPIQSIAQVPLFELDCALLR